MDSDPHRDDELNTLLRRLDHPLPAVTADDIVARAASHPRPLRAAAAIVFLLAAAAAAALPGSPVRSWFDQDAPPHSATTVQSSTATTGGIAVDPGASLIVRFDGVAGFVRVTITDDHAVIVRTAADAARFSSEPGHLDVELLSADTVAVHVPRGATHVELVAGRRTLFVQRDDDIRALQSAGPDGTWLMPIR